METFGRKFLGHAGKLASGLQSHAEQSQGPPTNPFEMACRLRAWVAYRLSLAPYRALFFFFCEGRLGSGVLCHHPVAFDSKGFRLQPLLR